MQALKVKKNKKLPLLIRPHWDDLSRAVQLAVVPLAAVSHDWNRTDLLYNFCRGGKIRFYLTEVNLDISQNKYGTNNLFRASCVPLEITQFCPKHFLMQKKTVIPGDNVMCSLNISLNK
jgi:hypothetical protein